MILSLAAVGMQLKLNPGQHISKYILDYASDIPTISLFELHNHRGSFWNFSKTSKPKSIYPLTVLIT